MKMKLVDGFPLKSVAKKFADDLRKQKVQYVQVRQINQGRLKWGVYVAGRNSSYYG